MESAVAKLSREHRNNANTANSNDAGKVGVSPGVKRGRCVVEDKDDDERAAKRQQALDEGVEKHLVVFTTPSNYTFFHKFDFF